MAQIFLRRPICCRRPAGGAFFHKRGDSPSAQGETFVRVVPVPLPGGVRGGFMVPIHAEKLKWALKESPILREAAETFPKSQQESGRACTAKEYDPRHMKRFLINGNAEVEACEDYRRIERAIAFLQEHL